jgi:hypothetical protein
MRNEREIALDIVRVERRLEQLITAREARLGLKISEDEAAENLADEMTARRKLQELNVERVIWIYGSNA